MLKIFKNILTWNHGFSDEIGM